MRIVPLLATIALVVGCSAVKRSIPTPSALIVNETAQTDAYLAACWKNAQVKVANRIDLNPTEVDLTGAPPVTLPGDPRALTSQPSGLIVRAVADSDGYIPCPAAPCPLAKAISWAEYTPMRITYAADLETPRLHDGLSYYVEYEMESEIMYQLGYEVSKR